MFRMHTALLIVLVGLGLSACQIQLPKDASEIRIPEVKDLKNPESWVAPSSAKSGTGTASNKKETQQNAAKGLGLGALTYQVLKVTGSDHPERWAAAIAAGTFIASEVVSREVARRRAEYESESDYLDAEIATAEESISERQKELRRVEEAIERHRRTVAQLEAQKEMNEESRKLAMKTLEELDQLIADLQEQRDIAEAEIEIHTEAVNSSKNATDEDVSEEELEERRTELLAKRDASLAQYDVLTKHAEEVQSLRDRLASR
ncbi:MAG: hypothetical protein AAF488_11330 [Planctomycetota bacterium]